MNRMIQLTEEELSDIIERSAKRGAEMVIEASNEDRLLVYGLDGLAELLKCSKTTAWKIKNSGVIDTAITQVGRKIVIDANKCLSLIRDSRNKNINAKRERFKRKLQ